MSLDTEPTDEDFYPGINSLPPSPTGLAIASPQEAKVQVVNLNDFFIETDSILETGLLDLVPSRPSSPLLTVSPKMSAQPIFFNETFRHLNMNLKVEVDSDSETPSLTETKLILPQSINAPSSPPLPSLTSAQPALFSQSTRQAEAKKTKPVKELQKIPPYKGLFSPVTSVSVPRSLQPRRHSSPAILGKLTT